MSRLKIVIGAYILLIAQASFAEVSREEQVSLGVGLLGGKESLDTLLTEGLEDLKRRSRDTLERRPDINPRTIQIFEEEISKSFSKKIKDGDVPLLMYRAYREIMSEDEIKQAAAFLETSAAKKLMANISFVSIKFKRDLKTMVSDVHDSVLVEANARLVNEGLPKWEPNHSLKADAPDGSRP